MTLVPTERKIEMAVWVSDSYLAKYCGVPSWSPAMHGVKLSPEKARTAAVGCHSCATAAIDERKSQVAVPGNVWTWVDAPASAASDAKSCPASEARESP